jgi:Uri superfamily endonuclease
MDLKKQANVWHIDHLSEEEEILSAPTMPLPRKSFVVHLILSVQPHNSRANLNIACLLYSV